MAAQEAGREEGLTRLEKGASAPFFFYNSNGFIAVVGGGNSGIAWPAFLLANWCKVPFNIQREEINIMNTTLALCSIAMAVLVNLLSGCGLMLNSGADNIKRYYSGIIPYQNASSLWRLRTYCENKHAGLSGDHGTCEHFEEMMGRTIKCCNDSKQHGWKTSCCEEIDIYNDIFKHLPDTSQDATPFIAASLSASNEPQTVSVKMNTSALCRSHNICEMFKANYGGSPSPCNEFGRLMSSYRKLCDEDRAQNKDSMACEILDLFAKECK